MNVFHSLTDTSVITHQKPVGVEPPVLIAGLPVAAGAVHGAVDELRPVVLIQAEVIAWVSDLACT